ncbi:MAG: GreA/GreB family elongation factor [Chitinophagaceae bacterium]
MKELKEKLILLKSDYELLLTYIFSKLSPMSGDYRNAEQLYEELKLAEVHENAEDIPADVVRINSMVEVEELETQRRQRFQIVAPARASQSTRRLSVFAPLSIALIGYRCGQQVSWQMSSGNKLFMIRNVVNKD